MQEPARSFELPSPWELAAPLAGSGSLGAVYQARDRRFQTEDPPAVVVRILEHADEAPEWRRRIEERLRTLAAHPLPHISPVLDAGGADGACWLVSPRHDLCVWSVLTQDAGLEPNAALDVFEQLLEGLAALHRRGLAHGDVRTKNVFLDDPKSRRPAAWLADAAVGPLTWWSRGTFLSNDARRYYPPEWRGAPQEPTPEADVYALGLTVCELFLGREAIPARNGKDAAEDESGASQLVARLKAEGVAAPVRKLLAAMLADDPTQRLGDAEESLSRWRSLKAPRRRGRWMVAAFVLAVLAAVLGYLAGHRGKPALHEGLAAITGERNRLREQLTATQQQLAQLEAASRSQQQTIDEQAETIIADRAEIDRLAARIAELEQPAVPTSVEPSPQERETVSPEAVAQQHWAALLASLDQKDLVERLEQAVRSGAKHQPAEAGKAEYRSYYDRVRRFRSRPHLTTWVEEDARLASLAGQLLETPWDDGLLQQAEARYAALEQAARQWAAWADPGSNMTWEGIRVQIEGKEGLSEESRRILKGWYAAVEEQASRGWTLVLLRGQCQEGYGADRIVRVYVNGKQQGEPSFHTWDSPTAHEYKTNEDFRRLSFPWRPGQTFGLSLEQNGSLYNTNIITVHYQKPFDGPLAVWAADRAGVTKSKLGELEFEIKANAGGGRLASLPGPPEAVLSSLGETVRRLLD